MNNCLGASFLFSVHALSGNASPVFINISFGSTLGRDCAGICLYLASFPALFSDSVYHAICQWMNVHLYFIKVSSNDPTKLTTNRYSIYY